MIFSVDRKILNFIQDVYNFFLDGFHMTKGYFNSAALLLWVVVGISYGIKYNLVVLNIINIIVFIVEFKDCLSDDNLQKDGMYNLINVVAEQRDNEITFFMRLFVVIIIPIAALSFDIFGIIYLLTAMLYNYTSLLKVREPMSQDFEFSFNS